MKKIVFPIAAVFLFALGACSDGERNGDVQGTYSDREVRTIDPSLQPSMTDGTRITESEAFSREGTYMCTDSTLAGS